MVKHLRAGCQSCRQNCKEIQSQKAEVDRFSFRMRYCPTASSWQGELYTSQGRQERTVAYACLHEISYNMELSSNTAYQSLQMSWKKFCCRNLFSPWGEHTIMDCWSKTNCTSENVLKVSYLQRTCNRTLWRYGRDHTRSMETWLAHIYPSCICWFQ